MTKEFASACTSFHRATNFFFVSICGRRSALLTCAFFSLSLTVAQDFSISPLPFNSKYFDEFAPLKEGESIYFISNRKPELLATTVTSKGEYAPGLFQWQNGSLISQEAWEKAVTGPLAISCSGKMLTEPTEGNTLGLFFENPDGSRSPFPFNSPSYSISQPFLNKTGDTLYFSSDMPGGKGDADLYFSAYEKNTWTRPKNIETVNTEYMEIFPAGDNIGNLIFSSNRSGNYDIYISSGNTKPIPFPEPVNGPGHEISMLPLDSGKAFLVTDRMGTQDIFMVRNHAPICSDKIPWKPTELCYTFFEESSLDSHSNDLDYEWNIESVKYPGNEATHCFNGPGEYLVELNIIDKLSGDIFYNEITLTHQIVPQQQVTASLTSSGIIIDSIYTYLPEIHDAELYAEVPGNWFRKAQIGEVIAPSETESITMAARGKTNSGNDTCLCFTQSVFHSGKQAMNKVDPGTKSTDKITEDQPEKSMEEVFRLEILRTKERVSDRQKAFNLPGDSLIAEEWFLPQDSLYSYTIGETNKPEELFTYYTLAKSSGIESAMVKSFDREKVLSLEDIAAGADVNNSVLRIGNIYFESGSAKITGESVPVLRKVAEILNQRPGLIVEISAHTDSRGGHESNLKLSDLRGSSIKSFLQEKGVEPERLVSTGFGESKPVAGNETEQGRAKNRRIEFRFSQLENTR